MGSYNFTFHAIKEQSIYKERRTHESQRELRVELDVRFLLPPLINLIAMLLQMPQTPQQQPQSSTTTTLALFQPLQYPFLTSALLFLAIFISFIFFLCTPVQIHFNPTLVLHFRFGFFSARLAIAMLSSFIFPAQIFWMLFVFIILTIPFAETSLFIFNTLLQRLQCLPPAHIVIWTNPMHPQPPPYLPPSSPHQLASQSNAIADQPNTSGDEAV